MAQNTIRKSLLASVDDPHTFSYLVPQLKQHWQHCFDYLRQSLMCLSDLTLENLEKNDRGQEIKRVDGWGTTHMCPDYGAIVEWAEKARSGGEV